jgi:Fe-S cluster assembly protein SufD
MAGLYLLKGREHVDNHTRMDHVAPHGSSNQQFKGILDDQSHGVFTGRVVVHPEGQQTDAQQTNRNLMLSDTALVHTDPQLEIFADDVKCSHGSTVGQVDPEALFYFMTRGIDEVAARRLLIRGFAEEVLHQIRHSALRAVADELVHNWLADGESL